MSFFASFRTGRLLAVVLGVASIVALTAPANAATVTSSQDGGVLAIRNFDAVTTAAERRGWKHLALIDGEYAIFNDSGLIEGPRPIRQKWPFLPEQFKTDIDSASVVFEGSRWRYTFVKGAEVVEFFDNGIVLGPQNYASRWNFLGPVMTQRLDGISAHQEGTLVVRLATSGEFYQVFIDQGNLEGPGLIRNRWPFLPPQFFSDLDDVSMEFENNQWKISFYKGTERVVFFDRGPIMEHSTSDRKWPFLVNWLTE